MRESSGRWGAARAWGVLLVGWLAGCASAPRSVALTEALSGPTGGYRIEFAPAQAADAARVQQSVDAAQPRLALWGALSEPLVIQVLPTHAALEAAVNQHGYGWLRAWGRYGEVFIQAPSTWGLASATQPQLNEVLLHELTHSLMYQLASDRLGWSRKRIPLWFREGMASYTAEQGYRWVSLEEISRVLNRSPEMDPVGAPGALYRDDSNFVYGVAHHAFAFLVKRYGEEGVRGVLREMKAGKEFPEAFGTAIGLTPEAFVRDFTRYVRWRGFQGGRLPPKPAEG